MYTIHRYIAMCIWLKVFQFSISVVFRDALHRRTQWNTVLQTQVSVYEAIGVRCCLTFSISLYFHLSLLLSPPSSFHLPLSNSMLLHECIRVCSLCVCVSIVVIDWCFIPLISIHCIAAFRSDLFAVADAMQCMKLKGKKAISLRQLFTAIQSTPV